MEIAPKSNIQSLKLFNDDEIVQPGALPEQVVTPGNGGAAFSDPAFANNKLLPIHRWVPWIAGFSSDFVRASLQRYLPERGIVLDPFAGVGTTLFEAVLLSHQAIGFEINPYALLASKVKLNAYRISVERLWVEIRRLKVFYIQCITSEYVPVSRPPTGFRTRADFYSPKVLHKVLIFYDFCPTIEDSLLQELFNLAFAATMVRYSNYSYEPSLTRRVSSGKSPITDFPVVETIIGKLEEMAEDITWFQNQVVTQELSIQVINDTFFNYPRYIQANSVDLIVTSPPYLNNYHYNRNTRPQLYWLRYANQPQDFKHLEETNFGKYWQTVRDLERVDLDFVLPGTDISERLQNLRSVHPEKKSYGGNGWANYAASYFNDCRRFAQAMHYVLKPGGTALIVIGNSILQGILIPTDQYFAKIAESVGLEVVKIEVPRTTRVGSSIIQSTVRVVKAQDDHQLYESVIELKKPRLP